MSVLSKALSRREGQVGATIVLFVAGVALIGPFVAPHSPTLAIGVPAAHPGSSAWLGTDELGRDVLSRVLHGGRSVLWLGTAATLLAYGLGLVVGLVAGFARSIVDSVLMRTVDIVLAFPALLVLLVLLTGAGNSVLVLVIGVALVQFPGISRIVRTATLETRASGYVDAAIGRGERAPAILRREILPNIFGSVVATAGLRFTLSIILISSINYLGLGLQPPTADWGLMVSENQSILSLNPFTTLVPAGLLALLTIGITMVGDGLARSLDQSQLAGAPA